MRPISLLCVASKLYERLILPRFYKYIECHLSLYQFAFQKGLSTLDALLLLSNQIRECLSRPSRGKPFLFLDIKKAYDSLWISGLLHKLVRMRVPIFYVKLMHMWLTNRYVYAKSGTKSSTWRQVFKGLPQGGVLCCILWAVFINDLPEFLAPECKCLLYADDVQASPHAGGTEGGMQLSRAADSACVWANKWRLVWSTESLKSTYISVNINIPSALIKLYGIPLVESDAYKYLGLIFSNDGSWLSHWKKTLAKLQSVSNLIRKFSVNTSVSTPSDFIVQLCRQVSQAILSYGFPIWAPPISSFAMADELVIKPFAKAVGSPWNAGTLVCYIEAGLMPLEMLWDYTALLHGIRIFKSKLPSVKLGLKGVLNEYNARSLNSIVRGESSYGSCLRWLESSWDLSLGQHGKFTLRKRRITILKRLAANKPSALALLRLRENLFVVPPYLSLPREYVTSMFRFRIGYGPDLASLKHRGLYRDTSQICRLCSHSTETREHLLCDCLHTRSRLPYNWRSFGERCYISDSIFSSEDFFRIAAFLKSISDDLSKVSTILS